MSELEVLRTIALKGRVPLDDVVATTGLDLSVASSHVDGLTTAGHLSVTPNGALRTTPEGRAHLQELLGGERAIIDQAAMQDLYDAFTEINARAKEVFTAWQVRDDGEPNEHHDASYDEGVLERLTAVHDEVLPIIEAASSLTPRAGRYRDRLVKAQQLYAAGDHTFVTRPIIDSYHTVWFEMHEDLISWAGLTRASEAAAGRAT